MMMILAIVFLHVCALLGLFCAAMWIHERFPRLAAVRFFRAQSAPIRLAIAGLLVVAVIQGSDKSPGAAQIFRAAYLTIMRDGTMPGPAGVAIASRAGADAIDAVVSQTAQTLATISNRLEWAMVDIPLLEEAVTNTRVAWICGDIPASTNVANPVARCELIGAQTNAQGNIDTYVLFNQTPASAPIVRFEAQTDPATFVSFDAVSNSFPHKVSVAIPGGVAQCYRYTIKVPDSCNQVSLFPVREIGFGRDAERPLKVLGAVMVGNNIGRTVRKLCPDGKTEVYTGGILTGVE